ncbi:MAG: YitT family protein [Synergistaceae bacterium]|nr:YitT family protein [Synergistaceae bacterium]
MSGTLGRGVVNNWKSIVAIVLCNLLTASAVANFTLPYRFPDMGVSGVAYLAHYALHIPPSYVIAACNALLLLWGRKNLNLRFLGLTTCSIAVFTTALPFFIRMPLPLSQDKFMAAVIGGVLKGLSGGMMFHAGGSGGGTDIIAMVLRRRYGIEVGQFTIFVNMAILFLSLGIVGLDSVVYGMVGLYIYGLTLDNVMLKFDRRKQAFIITNKPEEVSAFITAAGKGVTRIDGIGMYTKQPRPVLISLLEPRHVVQLKTFLQEEDPKAFVSICDAAEVLGQGFKSWKSL